MFNKVLVSTNNMGVEIDTQLWQLLPAVTLFIVPEDRGALLTIQWLCLALHVSIGGKHEQ